MKWVRDICGYWDFELGSEKITLTEGVMLVRNSSPEVAETFIDEQLKIVKEKLLAALKEVKTGPHK